MQGAVGGAAGVIHVADSATTDCQPNDNVEALRVFMDQAGVEARPVWKPMHKQPVYRNAPAYTNGVSESIFKVGMCLPDRMSLMMMCDILSIASRLRLNNLNFNYNAARGTLWSFCFR